MSNPAINIFEQLIRELDHSIPGLNQEGSQLFAAGKYDEAKMLIAKVETLIGLREKIKALEEEWTKLALPLPHFEPAPQTPLIPKQFPNPRLVKGIRTGEAEFKNPILEALVEIGGSGSIVKVISIVEKKMSDRLNDVDRQILKSTPGKPRWRNTAQWERNTLVNEGLMKKGSPHGVWEISDAGRALVEKAAPVKKNGMISTSLGDIPAKLYFALKVFQYVKSGAYSYSYACEKVAQDNNIPNSALISEACTGTINLSVDQFYDMTKNNESFVARLLAFYPAYRKQILRSKYL